MGLPLVTVFMAVYNAEEYISSSLESILNQSYKNLEILIVDDCSDDESIKIISSYNDPRIKLIKNNENMGIPFTRNIGLSNANGKYMAVMDSDDISYLTRIERQVKYLEENPTIDAIGTYYRIMGNKISRKIKSKFKTPEELSILLLFSSPIANPTSMIRMETIRKNDIIYNNNYFVAQDYDLWCQISKVGKLAILPEVLFKYRKGHLNISKLSKEKKSKQREEIINNIHESVIRYYSIQFNEQDIRNFNQLFSDNPNQGSSNLQWEIISDLYNVLIKFNDKNDKFDEKTYSEVVKSSFVIAISNLQLKGLAKIKLYFHVIKEKRIKSLFCDILYFILKDGYKFLSRRSLR